VSAVTVRLRDASDSLIDATRTVASGGYAFAAGPDPPTRGLLSGMYQVEYVARPGPPSPLAIRARMICLIPMPTRPAAEPTS